MTDDELAAALLAGWARGRLLNDYVFGLGPFMPAYPTHGTIRRCPFCEGVYRVHGGFSDHRDECPERPMNGHV